METATISLPEPGLSVASLSPAAGETVSGKITWEVEVSGTAPERVDFAVDGVVGSSETSPPYRFGGTAMGLDTTSLTNGPHTLTATAVALGGVRTASAEVTVTVANTLSLPPEPAYWGAWIGDQLTGTAPPWDMSALSAFEQLAGKGVSLLQLGQPFAECVGSSCSYFSFPTAPFTEIRAHGAIPFLSWSSQSIPSSIEEPDFQLSEVVAGTYDSYIQSWAEAAKAWGHPFFLRFDWEMNGSWFPWGAGVNGNQAGEYVAAWKHVHDIFAAVGADNASWVWCPYVDPHGTLADLAALYPGDEYVDWTCLDGYNWGASATPPRTWRSFEYLFGPSYAQITESIAPSKPILVGETASSESGGSKAGWIHNMFEALETEFPRFRGLLWFDDYQDGMDWPLETSKAATNAFKTGIADPRYLANSVGGLSSSPIPTP